MLAGRKFYNRYLYRGNDCLVDSYKKIRTPYHFGEVPALANRVVLQNVVPKKENSQPFEWEKEVLDKLYTYIFYQNNWYDIRIKYAEKAVHDLPIKVTMVHKVKWEMLIFSHEIRINYII